MRIIPVLDLKGGAVVRARQGQRDSYRPIVTPLAGTSRPRDVATGLRRLHPFDAFYIADLDAIEGRGPNNAAIADLKTMPNPPSLWIDAGLSDREAFDAALDDPLVRPVLGTESQGGVELLVALAGHRRLILSLDFFADGYRGPPDILEHPKIWPATVIVMSLARVGSAGGPDFERLLDVKQKAGDRAIVAAGGIRDEADLRSLSAMGIQAALIATSLHDGTLTAAQLTSLGA